MTHFNKVLACLLVSMVGILPAYAGKKKDDKNKKEKSTKEKPAKAFVRATTKNEIDGASGERNLAIMVSVKNASSGTVYAIYKHKSVGGVYSCETRTFGETAAKKGKKGKKKKGKKDKAKSKKGKAGKKDKSSGKSKEIVVRFPHISGDATFLCYIVEAGDAVYSPNPVWGAKLDKIKGAGTGSTFGTNCESKDAVAVESKPVANSELIKGVVLERKRAQLRKQAYESQKNNK